jgi:hypothetical protein
MLRFSNILEKLVVAFFRVNDFERVFGDCYTAFV